MTQLNYHWIPASPDVYTKGRPGPITGIVIHSTDGGCTASLDWLTGGSLAEGHPVSVHWLIDRDGTIYHLVADADTAWHVGAAIEGWTNSHVIGIELVHMDGSDPWPDPQIQACAQLVQFLQQDNGGNLQVRHHAQVALPPGRKVDPLNFPSDSFWAAVGKLLGETIEAVQV